MASKQLVTLSGTVEAINAKGVKVLGEWCNFSQYHPIISLPVVGQIVELQVEQTDKGVWINSLDIAEAASLPPSSDRDREIRRMACLKAAASFASGRVIAGQDVSSKDVLAVAEAFERWVLKGGEQTA